METNRYGDIKESTAGGMAATMLKVAKALLVTERFGQFDPQPKNKSTTHTFRRYHVLPKATAPLVEGQTPTGQKIRFTDYQVALEQWGDFVELTDVIEDCHTDPVVQIYSQRCGQQAAETVEASRISVLKGGTTVFYAGGSVTTRGTVTAAPTAGDFQRIYRFMRKNKAQMISEVVKASVKVATEPIGAAYFAMCSTDLDYDLRRIAGFVPVEKYSDSDKALPGEIGKIQNIRIICTTEFEPWLAAGASGTTFLSNGETPSSSAAADVYPIIVVGQNAYGIVPLAGENGITPSVVQPKPAQGDPLGQRGSVGWKTMQASKITNELWIARLECCATANPS